MEKANNMMTDNDMMCWHALYTAPKSEHKLMQRLNAAGYTTYCPMQAVFVKWKGHTRKVITPLRYRRLVRTNFRYNAYLCRHVPTKHFQRRGINQIL